MSEHKPEWEACRRHAPDTYSMKVAWDMCGESPGYKFVFIKMKCKKCGCPGEIVVDMPTDEISWGPEED